MIGCNGLILYGDLVSKVNICSCEAQQNESEKARAID